MIDLEKLKVFTPREKIDYLNGVKARLLDSIRVDRERVRSLCDAVLNDTAEERDSISLSIGDHTSEMKGLADNILTNQAALRLINSAYVSIREEHYKESNELL